MVLLLLQGSQQAAPAALSTEDMQQQEITQRMPPNFFQQTQNSEMVVVVNNPKALQARSQIEQVLWLLAVESPVNAMVAGLWVIPETLQMLQAPALGLANCPHSMNNI